LGFFQDKTKNMREKRVGPRERLRDRWKGPSKLQEKKARQFAENCVTKKLCCDTPSAWTGASFSKKRIGKQHEKEMGGIARRKKGKAALKKK